MASTGPVALVAVVCLCLGAITFADALRCLQCPADGVEDITQCDTIAKCDANEVCFTEAQIQGDRVRYYAGCGFEGKCLHVRLNPIGRRDDNLLCRQCCQDQDFCNSHLCDTNTKIGDNYTLCLTGITSSPDTSDKIKYCNPAEECFSQVYFNGGSLQYHLGCDRAVLCGDVHPVERDLVLCANCCRDNFCNLDLCRPDRSTTTIPTTKQPTTVTIKQQSTTSPAPTAAPTHHGSHTQHTTHPHNHGDHTPHPTRHTPNTGGHGHATSSPDSVTPVQQTNPQHQTHSSAALVHSSTSAPTVTQKPASGSSSSHVQVTPGSAVSSQAAPLSTVTTEQSSPASTSTDASTTIPTTDVQSTTESSTPPDSTTYDTTVTETPTTEATTPTPEATTLPSTTPVITSTPAAVLSTTPPHAPVHCEICDSTTNCVLSPKLQFCPPAQPFCMNTVTLHFDGQWELKKGCASDYECRTKWWSGSSDQDSCTSFNPLVPPVEDIECYFCCTSNNCNERVARPEKSLYTLDSRKR